MDSNAPETSGTGLNEHSDERILDGFEIIPTEIIEEWVNGGYYSGDIPSLSYRHLGRALALRGWYTYHAWGQEVVNGKLEAQPKEKQETGVKANSNETGERQYRGIAIIDIKGPSLFMGGIRLFNELGQLYDNEKKRAIVFWKSEISYFLNDNEIIWFYHAFNHVDEDFLDKILQYYLPENSWLKESEDQWNARHCLPRFGFTPKEWNHLLDQLRLRLDDDLRTIENRANELKKQGKDIIGRVLMHHDLTNSRLQYRQILSGGGETDLITGSSRLNKERKEPDIK